MGRSSKQAQETEQILAGKPPSEDGGLDPVARFVREAKEGFPAAPTPELEASHLKAIMQEVQATLQRGESLAPAPSAPQSPSPVSRFRKILFRGAGTSLALKVLGGAVALAGTTGGLAALEALPGPAQSRVATAVEAVSPFELPGNEEPKAPDSGATLQVEEVRPTQSPAAVSPNPNADFGQGVATDAQDGGVDGHQVSETARERNQQRREEGQAHRPPETDSPGPDHVPGPPPGAGTPPGGPPAGAGGPQNGLDRAGNTPAGQNVPQSVPAGPPAGPPVGVSSGR